MAVNGRNRAIVPRGLRASIALLLALSSACDSQSAGSAAQSGTNLTGESLHETARMAPRPGDDALRACIKDLATRRPAEDAAADVARGDLDFHFDWGPENSYAYAPGLAECEAYAPPGGKRSGRQGWFDKFSVEWPGRADLRTECQMSANNYRAAYNRAKAALRPASFRTNCNRGRGRIDPSYKPFDVDAFRREAEKTYGK